MTGWTSPSMGRWVRQHAGVRLRLTAATAAVVAAFVALGGVALVLLLGRNLANAADASASLRAHEIATIVQRDGIRAVRQSLSAGTSETSIAQVLGQGGKVIANSAQIQGEIPLTDTVARPGSTVHERLDSLPVGDGTAYWVVSAGLRARSGAHQVIVAQTLAPAQSSVRTVSALLVAGVPILALVTGGATFALTGRILRPVESIRRQVSDITARNLSRRVPVPKANDEISSLAETMNDMLGRLDAAQVAQRHFVADASHELRSPLATVKASLDVAGSHPAQAEWPETYATLTAEVQRLERITSDLLILAQADDSNLRLRSEEVDLDDLVGVERNRLRSTTSLEIGGSVAPVRCRGDRYRLSQALRNLVDNAAAQAGSRVDVSLFSTGTSAVIEVSDDGPGIPPADRERIFQRFVRLDESRARSSGGAGLGLAIVSEVIGAHGGSVNVFNGIAGGACFRVVLPS